MIFGRTSRKQIFDDCRHIWSVLKEITSKNGPFSILDCKHIWSISKLRLHPYQVPLVIDIASIFGPCHGINCNHMWFSPIPVPIWSFSWILSENKLKFSTLFPVVVVMTKILRSHQKAKRKKLPKMISKTTIQRLQNLPVNCRYSLS